jgi:hypothetical protein
MARRRVETTRVSASIPAMHAEALQRMADRDRVSVSHVIAIAIERAVEAAEGGLLLETRSDRPHTAASSRKARHDAA